MTVSQLRDALKAMEDAGRGGWPVMFDAGTWEGESNVIAPDERRSVVVIGHD